MPNKRERWNGLTDAIIGTQMRRKRLKKGILAKFVADKMGISNGYLCDLERGNRHWSAKLVRRYNKAINVE